MGSSLTLISLMPSNLFSEDRIKVGKYEAGTSAFNQEFDKFHSNNYKAQ